MSSASASSHLLQRPSGAEQHLRQHEDRLLRVQLVADFVQAAGQAEARQNRAVTAAARIRQRGHVLLGLEQEGVAQDETAHRASRVLRPPQQLRRNPHAKRGSGASRQFLSARSLLQRIFRTNAAREYQQ